MSNEQQTHINTLDIKRIKNAVWALGILIACVTAIWGLATRFANKDNAEITYRNSQLQATIALKNYFDFKIQQLRTKDSTDISTVNLNVVNLINQNALQTAGEIRLLREQCRRMMSTGSTFMHTYDDNGNVVPGINRISKNK